jgi:hypothetical protein
VTMPPRKKRIAQTHNAGQMTFGQLATGSQTNDGNGRITNTSEPAMEDHKTHRAVNQTQVALRHPDSSNLPHGIAHAPIRHSQSAKNLASSSVGASVLAQDVPRAARLHSLAADLDSAVYPAGSVSSSSVSIAPKAIMPHPAPKIQHDFSASMISSVPGWAKPAEAGGISSSGAVITPRVELSRPALIMRHGMHDNQLGATSSKCGASVDPAATDQVQHVGHSRLPMPVGSQYY